jgi:hypothetical protein
MIVGTVQKVVTGIKLVKVLLLDPYVIEGECVWLFTGNILKAELGMKGISIGDIILLIGTEKHSDRLD